MSDLESVYANAVGFTAVDIAELARTEFHRILGKTPDEKPGALVRWLDAVEWLFVVCHEQEEHNWDRLALRMAGCVVPNIDWEQQPLLLRLAWQAVSRHVVNLIIAEDRGDCDTACEYDWREWVLRRVQSQT